MKQKIFNISLALFLGLALSASNGHTNPFKTQINDQKSMNSYISIFEIPATDYERAVDFYESIMGFSIETIDMQGTTMGLFPVENQQVAGAIVKGEGYEPSAVGVTIYLNAGENLQPMLDKVAANGGEVVLPKTHIDDENGYFAMFLDTEGNRIGLHSPH